MEKHNRKHRIGDPKGGLPVRLEMAIPPNLQNPRFPRNGQKKVTRTRKLYGSAQNFAAIIWCFHPQSWHFGFLDPFSIFLVLFLKNVSPNGGTLAPLGPPWGPMGAHGGPWGPMGPHGPPWGPTGAAASGGGAKSAVLGPLGKIFFRKSTPKNEKVSNNPKCQLWG